MVNLLVTGSHALDVRDALVARGFDDPLRAVVEPSDEDFAWATAVVCRSLPDGMGYPWVHSLAAGYDQLEQARHRIGVLTRTLGSLPQQMAQSVAWAVLDHRLNGAHYRRAQADARWDRIPHHWPPGTCVLLGTGEIAQVVARALQTLGFRTVGVNRSGRSAPGFDEVTALASVPLEDAQVLVNLLPLTQQTRLSVDEAVLGRLRGALYVNVGRGDTTCQDSLRRALDAGQVQAAHLDVMSPEPLPAEHWLWRHPKVTITPHCAAITLPGDVADDVVQTLAELRRGERPRLAVPSST
ncbi:NAD(P)-dependent oxidoreductase [Luteococcus sp. Sow4_B9]|uniref:NAD(P)-dependent oxidoreductase n=1 Tax=Luteococcus sp. Sow4_B9 TaxID=3438792 RepID=UPI003F94EA03